MKTKYRFFQLKAFAGNFKRETNKLIGTEVSRSKNCLFYGIFSTPPYSLLKTYFTLLLCNEMLHGQQAI